MAQNGERKEQMVPGGVAEPRQDGGPCVEGGAGAAAGVTVGHPAGPGQDQAGAGGQVRGDEGAGPSVQPGHQTDRPGCEQVSQQ